MGIAHRLVKWCCLASAFFLLFARHQRQRGCSRPGMIDKQLDIGSADRHIDGDGNSAAGAIGPVLSWRSMQGLA